MKYIAIKNITSTENQKILRKPSWIRIKLPSNNERIKKMKDIMRKNNLYSVCEEASCPNLSECFNIGTATFMILGAICTRRCSFCNVQNGRPEIPNVHEPNTLAKVINDMGLTYIVITSVNRDDLYDGGVQHFVNCINSIRMKSPLIKIEILVPDFRGCMDNAIKILTKSPPDIFNHNVENVPRLYKNVRPGSDYNRSLKLLENFKKFNPKIPTKSGLIMGLGETVKEIICVMNDLYNHGVTMLTIGQYLQPSKNHIPVKRYISPQEFDLMKRQAFKIGFSNVACGPFVRSSYHADLQMQGAEIK